MTAIKSLVNEEKLAIGLMTVFFLAGMALAGAVFVSILHP